jgi:hypothetical protein
MEIFEDEHNNTRKRPGEELPSTPPNKVNVTQKMRSEYDVSIEKDFLP